MINVLNWGVDIAKRWGCLQVAAAAAAVAPPVLDAAAPVLEHLEVGCLAAIKYTFEKMLLPVLSSWGRRQLSSSPEAKPKVGAVPTSAKPRGMVGMAIDIGLDIGGKATTAVTDIGAILSRFQ